MRWRNYIDAINEKRPLHRTFILWIILKHALERKNMNATNVISLFKSLILHMRTHTGYKPYHCIQWDKAFTQNCILIRHLRTHRGDNLYQCNQCNKAFTQNNILITYMRTHTEEKPYQCNHCDKSFFGNSNFQKHIRTHTREKSYQNFHFDTPCLNIIY